ncbi:hypothetical protein SLNWT_1025 [Streptomyces albus]|uniref:Uncharacterized protein n=1 Tax=Streptomyces albus (strain ATCC 21838 / DSM 41398 / FERM P-419 / JCM 4703 / NBRC 107858) TaxID=1081613 RepID=A0A0B5ERM3_STRA4|nr:hypothetical protein SLNWT_1025 [Streptomyces albus]AOU75717.1 hypothetical protein SLNHY_1026 [Streptomyces albus]AYN31519.1 hypothetical protein DUI70_1015 [Streptomyces albus]
MTVGAVTLLPPPQGEEDPGTRTADEAGAPLSGPPAGHPERAVPTLPLSEVERALWSQLS